MTVRLVVDSDGGIDDATALAWLACRADVELAAVTAVGGNCGVTQAARNIRVVLEAVGAYDVPVYVGAEPTAPAPPSARPVMIHGEDGLGDVGLPDPHEGAITGTPVVDVLSRELRRGAALLSLGPMTNVAAVVTADPEAVRQSAGFTFMGGSAGRGGNARPLGEANVVHDPLAAAAALAAPWSTPPVMVGLDVTHQATLRDTEFAAIAEQRTPVATLLDAPLRYYRRNGGTFCAPGETPCHDLLAAMACVDPTFVGTELLPVEVDTAGGAAWGATVVDQRVRAWRAAGRLAPGELPDPEQIVNGNRVTAGPPLRVSFETDVERFRREVAAMAGADR